MQGIPARIAMLRLSSRPARFPLLRRNLWKFTALNLVLQLTPVFGRSLAGFITDVRASWSWSDPIILVALSWIAIPTFLGRFEWSERRHTRYTLIAYGIGAVLLMIGIAGRETSTIVEHLVENSRRSALPDPLVTNLAWLEQVSKAYLAPALFLFSLVSMYWFLIHAHKRVLCEVNVRLRWHHQAQFAGIYMAKEAGIFERNGLNALIHERDPNKPLINVVGSGQNEFGIVMAPEVVRFRSDGRELVAIEILSVFAPLELLVNQVSIKNKIARGGPIRVLSVEYYIEDQIIGDVLLKKYHIGETPIEVGYYSDNQGAADFLKGSYDAIVVHRANEKIYLQRVMFHGDWDSLLILNPMKFGLKLLGETLVTRRVEAEDHPKMVEAVKRSVIQGWEAAATDEDKAAFLSLRYRRQSSFAAADDASLDDQLRHQKTMLAEMVFMFQKGRSSRSRQTEAIWKEVIQSCVKAGIIAKARVVKPEQLLGL